MEIFNDLNKICFCKKDVNLRTLCSIHIGGVGAYVCYPKNIKQVKRLIKFLNKVHMEYYIIGNGTNIVFEDGGYSAVLICFNKMNKFNVRGNRIVASAGLNLFALNHVCKINGLTGLEWSYGIPASVGGAVYMNAGAYGHEIREFVKNVWILTSKGKINKFSNEQMKFGYRKTAIHGTNYIILKVEFCLKNGNSNEIGIAQKEIFDHRRNSQPYETYNAGSIFKRTCVGSAGKTIDKLGLKSVKIGEIQISDKHANFFINLGNGTSEDLHKLIDKTKQTVYQKTGTILEEEIIFVQSPKQKE